MKFTLLALAATTTTTTTTALVLPTSFSFSANALFSLLSRAAAAATTTVHAPAGVHPRHSITYTTIPEALTNIADAIETLNTTATNYQGDALTLSPLIRASVALQLRLEAGTRLASSPSSASSSFSSSLPLTPAETVQIASAAASLTKNIDDTIATFLRVRPRFDAVYLASSLVRAILDVQRESARAFGTAVTSRLPAHFFPIASAVVKHIDDEYTLAVAAYKEGKDDDDKQ